MAYCGHKKEDFEDTSMDRHWKQARPEKPMNPWGNNLPAPQRGGGSEEDESLFCKLQSSHTTCNFQEIHCFDKDLQFIRIIGTDWNGLYIHI
jgi:hypothetical protein